jgi:hypothetical protein
MRRRYWRKVEIEMLLGNENVPPAMPQAQADALAERIASVLRARKQFRDERRTLNREYQRRDNNCTLARYHKLGGEVRGRSERRRTEEIDHAYVVMMSCNAAIDS